MKSFDWSHSEFGSLEEELASSVSSRFAGETIRYAAAVGTSVEFDGRLEELGFDVESAVFGLRFAVRLFVVPAFGQTRKPEPPGVGVFEQVRDRANPSRKRCSRRDGGPLLAALSLRSRTTE